MNYLELLEYWAGCLSWVIPFLFSFLPFDAFCMPLRFSIICSCNSSQNCSQRLGLAKLRWIYHQEHIDHLKYYNVDIFIIHADWYKYKKIKINLEWWYLKINHNIEIVFTYKFARKRWLIFSHLLLLLFGE